MSAFDFRPGEALTSQKEHDRIFLLQPSTEKMQIGKFANLHFFLDSQKIEPIRAIDDWKQPFPIGHQVRIWIVQIDF